MRLKHFRGANVADALLAVRREFGADALILATRRHADAVEITAAIEGAAETVAPPPTPAEAPLDREEMLRWHRVPRALADRLGAGALAAALAEAIGFAPLAPSGQEPALLLLGPPGAGKTVTVARIATRLVLDGVRPVVVAADDRRAGGREQLRAYTRVLGLELVQAETPACAARAVARAGGLVPVLIDGPAAHPAEAEGRAQVGELLDATGAEALLALPAGLDVAEAAEAAAGYAAIGARRIVATRCDLARRLGSLLGSAYAASLPLAEFGVGAGASDGLIPASPDWLGTRLDAAFHEGAPAWVS